MTEQTAVYRGRAFKVGVFSSGRQYQAGHSFLGDSAILTPQRVIEFGWRRLKIAVS